MSNDEIENRSGEQALEPVEQESIVFHEQDIVAVRLADGRICVVLRWICESLKLAPNPQVRRIERTAATADELVRVKVQTVVDRKPCRPLPCVVSLPGCWVSTPTKYKM